MSAVIAGSNNQYHDDEQQLQENDNHTEEKLNLHRELLSASKKCHIRFGGKNELATESDICVSHLCTAFENIFNHGLKSYTRMDKFNSALRYMIKILCKIFEHIFIQLISFTIYNV